ncbi:MAG: ABC transporter ATP-binding protein, partial [Acidobacteria bacterium]|nr:ABC transporter ATP-binding protein [Acidobacteriota bacterium]
IHTPRVLLLDEPTCGVDPVSRRDFWRLLAELVHAGVTIYVSTAYLDEAERFHRMALLHQGQLLACGTPKEVKKLLRGAILEIRCAEPRPAARALRREFPAASPLLFGDRIHLVSEHPEQDSIRAQAVLRSAGYPATDIRVIEPTLEDAFVSVLSEERPADGSRS